MVQVDGAESGGLVDPGVACWVGMSGEPEAREERGLSPWQFAVRVATWSSAELGLSSRTRKLPILPDRQISRPDSVLLCFNHILFRR